MKAGVFYDIPDPEYRSAPGVSQSALKVIERSPAHYKAGVEDCDEDGKDDTEALVIGRVVSTLVLEPNRQSWWTVKPDKVKLNETAGRDWAKEFLKWDESRDGKFPKSAMEAFDKKGVTLISFKSYQAACRMATAVKEHPTASLLLDGAKCEVSCFAEVETDYGIVPVKCRHDIVPGGNCTVDLKTALIATPEPFYKAIIQRGYDIQMASYMDMWNVLNPNDQKDVALLIAVEKSPPWGISIFRLSKELLERGRQKYRDLLNLYAYCMKTGEWPCYTTEIQTLELQDRHR